MRRLLIYLTYDPQNIIDDYIAYFLQSMRPLTATIAVVCNMPHIDRGLHNLAAYANHIFYRENIGLDAGGFKDALCTFIGWDRLAQYDELVLANDSFYGPFSDIGGIFADMESRSLDFWGLMGRGAGTYGATGSDPAHILSFFYVFQAPLLHSSAFRTYWEDMPYYGSYMDVVKQYERRLTGHFAELGYSWGTYADTAPNETENLQNQFFQCDYLAYEMITKRKFPFLKRKQMSNNTLFVQTQENIPQSLDYIERHTGYDAGLIWKNLIRTQNPAKLQRSLGLQFIPGGAEEKKRADVAVYVRAEWQNAAEQVCEYLERIRGACEIRILAKDRDIASYYQRRGFGGETETAPDSAVLMHTDRTGIRYICLVHDADLSSDRVPSCMGKSYFFNVWENLVKDAGHISAVAKLLDEKKYVGMLLHPVPVFGEWMGSAGGKWKEKYGEAVRWITRLGLCAVPDPETGPVHATGNFWIRSEVLEAFAPKYGSVAQGMDIPEDLAPYLWEFVVQDSGRLTGIVESAFYASMDGPNQQYYLTTFLGWFAERYGPHGRLHEYREIFFVQMAVEKCRTDHEDWYVYGTGEMAERCFPWLKDARAFVVSDGRLESRTFHGKPVICLSELEDDGSGIVLCLSRENQDKVVPLLEGKGIRDYYTVY